MGRAACHSIAGAGSLVRVKHLAENLRHCLAVLPLRKSHLPLVEEQLAGKLVNPCEPSFAIRAGIGTPSLATYSIVMLANPASCSR